MTGNTFYVIDSSSLIDMRLYYPMQNFQTLWTRCNELILEGRLAAPVAVLEELKRKDDELTAWANSHNKALFHEYSPYLLDQVSYILEIFPDLIDHTSEHEQADPFVIAMALDRRDGPQRTIHNYEVCVVTEERMPPPKGSRPRKIKIPEVCKQFEIPCISMVDIIRLEGWMF